MYKHLHYRNKCQDYGGAEGFSWIVASRTSLSSQYDETM